jgi:hypothetical protein
LQGKGTYIEKEKNQIENRSYNSKSKDQILPSKALRNTKGKK